MSLNSDALRLFLGVVDAGSMSAAAEMLGQTASGGQSGVVAVGRGFGGGVVDADDAADGVDGGGGALFAEGAADCAVVGRG